MSRQVTLTDDKNNSVIIVMSEEMENRINKDEAYKSKIFLEALRSTAVPGAKDSKAENSTENGQVEPRDHWNYNMVCVLLELIGQEQQTFQLPTTRPTAIKKITAEMKSKGHQWVTIEEIKKKWGNLQTTYRRIKDRRNPSGEPRTNWPFYSAVENLIGDKREDSPSSSAAAVYVNSYGENAVAPMLKLAQEFVEDESSRGPKRSMSGAFSDEEYTPDPPVRRKKKKLEKKPVYYSTKAAKMVAEITERLEDDYGIKLDTMGETLTETNIRIKSINDSMKGINSSLRVIANAMERFVNQ